MASSTGLIIVNKVLRELGESTVSTLANSTDNTDLIIDEINETIEELEREDNWSFLRASTTIVTTGSTSTATLSNPTDINLFRPLIRLLDTTDNIEIVEVPDDKWNDVTQFSDTSIPRWYRRFGSTTSNQMVLEFYPTPSAARTYTVNYWRELTRLTADASGDILTFPFPDSVIVNGTAWKHKDYVGDDFSTNLRKYELGMSRLKSANRISATIVMGSRRGSRNSLTDAPRRPTSFGTP